MRMELPVCRYRGPCEGGRCPCISPFVYAPDPRGAKDSDCARCRYADRVPTPAERKILGVSEGPAFIQKLKTFVRAVYRHFRNWLRAAPKAERARRLSICQACPFYLTSYIGGRCSKCGCGIAGALMDKTKWASESCPEGKW